MGRHRAAYVVCSDCETSLSRAGWEKLELVRTVTVSTEGEPLLDRLIEIRRCVCGVEIANTDDRTVASRGYVMPASGKWGVYVHEKDDEGWLCRGVFDVTVKTYVKLEDAKREASWQAGRHAYVRPIVRASDVPLTAAAPTVPEGRSVRTA
jgi:hypothetical protein